jgi:hypothetical protein
VFGSELFCHVYDLSRLDILFCFFIDVLTRDNIEKFKSYFSVNKFLAGQGRDIFLFNAGCRLAVGPTFYPVSTEGSFPGVKQPVHEAGHSPPLPNTSLWHGA